MRTSAVATKSAEPWRGRVQIVALPPSEEEAESIGIVSAVSSSALLPELVQNFAEKVASIGGNIGVVDSIRTRFEMVTTNEMYSYSCGDSKNYRTCSGYRSVTREHAITTVLGRGFRQVSNQ